MRRSILIAALLLGCGQVDSRGVLDDQSAKKPNASPASRDTPKEPGLYWDSPSGLVPLSSAPTVDAKDPSFLVKPENPTPIEKLRVRFGQSSKMMAIIQVAAGEKDGAYEAKLTALPTSPGVYRASYAGTLPQASYVVYTLVDASTGGVAWEASNFKFAGEFKVK